MEQLIFSLTLTFKH